jgi:hypothetical protein
VSSVIETSQLAISLCFTKFFLRVTGQARVDVAVASLNAAARDDMDQAIPRGYNRKLKFPPLFSNTLS